MNVKTHKIDRYKSTWMGSLSLLILFILLFTFISAQAKMYKWVDENNVTHYSSTPPPDRKTKEVENIDESAPGPSDSRGNSSMPTTRPAKTSPKNQLIRNAPGQNASFQEKKEHHCKTARNNLRLLKESKGKLGHSVNGKTVAIKKADKTLLIRNQMEKIDIYCK